MNCLERWKEWRAWRKKNGFFARIRMACRRAEEERMERAFEAIDKLLEEYKRKMAEKEREK